MTTYQLLQMLHDAREAAVNGRPDVLRAVLDEIDVDAAYVVPTLGTHWHGYGHRSAEAQRQRRMAESKRWIGTVEGNREVKLWAVNSEIYHERERMVRDAYESMGISYR